MANEKLKTYSIGVTADISEFLTQMDKLEKATKSQLKDVGLTKGIREDCEKTLKTITELKSDARNALKGLQESFDKISTGKLATDIQKVNDSLTRVNSSISLLMGSKSVSMGDKLATQIESLTSVVQKLDDKFKSISDTIENMGTNNEPIVNGQQFIAVTNEVDRLRMSLAQLSKMKASKAFEGVLSGKSHMLSEYNEFRDTIGSILSLRDKLNKEGSPLGSKIVQSFGIDSKMLESTFGKITQNLRALEKGTLSELREPKTLNIDIKLDKKKAINEVVEQVTDVVSNINDKLAKKKDAKIKLKTNLDGRDLNENVSEAKKDIKANVELQKNGLKNAIEREIKEVNAWLKTDAPRVMIEADVDVNRSKLLDKTEKFAQDVAVRNEENGSRHFNNGAAFGYIGGNVTVDSNSGLATENTLGDIREILRSWGKTGNLAESAKQYDEAKKKEYQWNAGMDKTLRAIFYKAKENKNLADGTVGDRSYQIKEIGNNKSYDYDVKNGVINYSTSKKLEATSFRNPQYDIEKSISNLAKLSVMLEEAKKLSRKSITAKEILESQYFNAEGEDGMLYAFEKGTTKEAWQSNIKGKIGKEEGVVSESFFEHIHKEVLNLKARIKASRETLAASGVETTPVLTEKGTPTDAYRVIYRGGTATNKAETGDAFINQIIDRQRDLDAQTAPIKDEINTLMGIRDLATNIVNLANQKEAEGENFQKDAELNSAISELREYTKEITDYARYETVQKRMQSLETEAFRGGLTSAQAKEYGDLQVESTSLIKSVADPIAYARESIAIAEDGMSMFDRRIQGLQNQVTSMTQRAIVNMRAFSKYNTGEITSDVQYKNKLEEAAEYRKRITLYNRSISSLNEDGTMKQDWSLLTKFEQEDLQSAIKKNTELTRQIALYEAINNIQKEVTAEDEKDATLSGNGFSKEVGGKLAAFVSEAGKNNKRTSDYMKTLSDEELEEFGKILLEANAEMVEQGRVASATDAEVRESNLDKKAENLVQERLRNMESRREVYSDKKANVEKYILQNDLDLEGQLEEARRKAENFSDQLEKLRAQGRPQDDAGRIGYDKKVRDLSSSLSRAQSNVRGYEEKIELRDKLDYESGGDVETIKAKRAEELEAKRRAIEGYNRRIAEIDASMRELSAEGDKGDVGYLEKASDLLLEAIKGERDLKNVIEEVFGLTKDDIDSLKLLREISDRVVGKNGENKLNRGDRGMILEDVRPLIEKIVGATYEDARDKGAGDQNKFALLQMLGLAGGSYHDASLALNSAEGSIARPNIIAALSSKTKAGAPDLRSAANVGDLLAPYNQEIQDAVATLLAWENQISEAKKEILEKYGYESITDVLLMFNELGGKKKELADNLNTYINGRDNSVDSAKFYDNRYRQSEIERVKEANGGRGNRSREAYKTVISANENQGNNLVSSLTSEYENEKKIREKAREASKKAEDERKAKEAEALAWEAKSYDEKKAFIEQEYQTKLNNLDSLYDAEIDKQKELDAKYTDKIKRTHEASLKLGELEGAELRLSSSDVILQKISDIKGNKNISDLNSKSQNEMLKLLFTDSEIKEISSADRVNKISEAYTKLIETNKVQKEVVSKVEQELAKLLKVKALSSESRNTLKSTFDAGSENRKKYASSQREAERIAGLQEALIAERDAKIANLSVVDSKVASKADISGFLTKNGNLSKAGLEKFLGKEEGARAYNENKKLSGDALTTYLESLLTKVSDKVKKGADAAVEAKTKDKADEAVKKAVDEIVTKDNPLMAPLEDKSKPKAQPETKAKSTTQSQLDYRKLVDTLMTEEQKSIVENISALQKRLRTEKDLNAKEKKAIEEQIKTAQTTAKEKGLYISKRGKTYLQLDRTTHNPVVPNGRTLESLGLNISDFNRLDAMGNPMPVQSSPASTTGKGGQYLGRVEINTTDLSKEATQQKILEAISKGITVKGGSASVQKAPKVVKVDAKTKAQKESELKSREELRALNEERRQSLKKSSLGNTMVRGGKLLKNELYTPLNNEIKSGYKNLSPLMKKYDNAEAEEAKRLQKVLADEDARLAKDTSNLAKKYDKEEANEEKRLQKVLADEDARLAKDTSELVKKYDKATLEEEKRAIKERAEFDKQYAKEEAEEEKRLQKVLADEDARLTKDASNLAKKYDKEEADEKKRLAKEESDENKRLKKVLADEDAKLTKDTSDLAKKYDKEEADEIKRLDKAKADEDARLAKEVEGLVKKYDKADSDELKAQRAQDKQDLTELTKAYNDLAKAVKDYRNAEENVKAKGDKKSRYKLADAKENLDEKRARVSDVESRLLESNPSLYTSVKSRDINAEGISDKVKYRKAIESLITVEKEENKQAREFNGTSQETIKKTNGISDSIKRLGVRYLSLRRLWSEFRKGLNYLLEYDKALTTISYTMDLSQDKLQALGSTMTQMAKDMGTSIQNAMQVAQIYANMKTTPEEIAAMAEPAIALANLTGASASDMADSIQAVKNAFGEDVGDFQHIADVMDYVSQNIAMDYAKGINGITEAVSVAGATAKDAGLSFEQLASIVGTTMETTRQEGSQVGNALKTILVRTSKASKLSGEEVDNETLSNASKALHKIGVEVYTTTGEYREFDVIMGELASKWDSLNDAQQQEIAYQIAATRQVNALQVILKNFSDTMGLAEDATNSEGSALANNEKWLDSYNGKLQEIKTSIEDWFIQGLQSDGFDFLLDTVKSLVDWLGKLSTSGIGISEIAMVITSVTGALKLLGTRFAYIKESTDGFRVSIKKLFQSQTQFIDLTKLEGRELASAEKQIKSAKIAMVGYKLATAAVAIGLSLLISKIISASQEAAKAREEASESAKTLSDNNSSIDDTIKKYEELSKKLEEQTEANEDTYEIKNELLTLQESLIDTFQDEANGIDLVNGKYDEQIAKIKELKKEEYGKWLSKNADLVKEAEDKVTDTDTLNISVGNLSDEYRKELQGLLSSLELSSASIGTSREYGYQVVGISDVNYLNAEEKLNELSDKIREWGEKSGVDVSEALGNIAEKIREFTGDEAQQYLEIYNTAQEAEIFASEKLLGYYESASQAIADYNDALASGDGISKARARIDSLTRDITSLGLTAGQNNVFKLLLDSYDKDAEREYNLEEYLKPIKISLTDTELRAMESSKNFSGEIGHAVGQIIRTLTGLGYTTDEIIDRMVELGVVAGKAEKETTSPYAAADWTDNQKKSIKTFQSGLNKVSEVLNKFRNGTKLTTNEIVDLQEEFPELQGVSEITEEVMLSFAKTLLTDVKKSVSEFSDTADKLYEDTLVAATGVTTLAESFDRIKSTYDAKYAFEKAVKNGSLTESELNTIAGLSENMKNLVAQYYSGAVSVEELGEALNELYDTDLKNYSLYVFQKNDLDTEFYNNAVENNAELIDAFADAYGVDLKNCKTWAEAKKTLMTGMITQLNAMMAMTTGGGGISTSGIARYYDVETNKRTSLYDELVAGSRGGSKDANAMLQVIAALESAYSGFGLPEFDEATFEKTAKKFKDASNDTKNTIDWCAQSIENLNHALSLLDKELESTSKFESKAKILESILTLQNRIVSAEVKSSKVYEDEYIKKASKISDAYKKRIESNDTFSIEEFANDSKMYEYVTNAQSAWKTWQDAIASEKEAIATLKNYATQLADIPWDKAQAKIEKLNKSNEILSAELSNANGYKEKNKILREQLKIQEKIVDSEKAAVESTAAQLDTAKTQASSLGFSEKQLASIEKNRLISTNKLTGEALEFATRWNALITEQRENTKQLAIDEANLENQRIESIKNQLANITSSYDNKKLHNQQKRTMLESAMSLAEANGEALGKAYYESLIKTNSRELDILQSEFEKYQKKAGELEIGSDAWYEAQSTLLGLKNSMDELTLSTANYNNSLKELEWSRFDKLKDSISELADEMTFLASLFDENDLFMTAEELKESGATLTDRYSALTSEGMGKMYSHASNYNTQIELTKRLSEEIARLDAEYANDSMNSKYLERRKELVSLQRESINASQGEKSAIIEMVKNGLSLEQDALQLIVNERKEALSLEKEAYEFKKKTTEQSKNILRIEKQIAALEGDDSDENRKKLRELKESLKDAKDTLEDTMYEKSVSDQQTDLDNMIKDSQKAMDNYLSDGERVFTDALTKIQAEGVGCISTLESTAKSLGYTISDNLAGALDSAALAFGNSSMTFDIVSASIVTSIDAMAEAWGRYYAAADSASQLTSTGIGVDISNIKSGGYSYGQYDKIREFLDKNGRTPQHEKSYYLGLNQHLYEKYGKVLTKSAELELGALLGVDVSGGLNAKLREEILKKLKAAGFSRGGIIEATGEDGVALVKHGEAILTRSQTEMFQKFTDIMPKIMPVIKNPILTTGTSVGANVTYQIDNSITVDGVATDELVGQMANIAKTQSEAVIKKINSSAYALGTRR